MTVQLLISTMHQKDRSLLEKMNVSSDAVVINQCDIESKETIEYNGHKVLWIDTTERGLSKSRNMAVANATADICLIADDDMIYRSDYVDTVINSFSKINADLIGFQVVGIERKFKNYSEKAQRIGYLKSMRMASVEIAFKRERFIEKNVVFDELIGSGTEFMMGEENVMLFDCLKKHLKVFYVPKEIADLHVGQSSWFSGMNEKFFWGKGAAFTAMKTPFTTFLMWQWAIRKKRLYKENFSFFTVLKLMQQGKKAYLKKAKGKK